MCIALFSTAHPDYALILINNRDEYFNRPTAPAHWWEAPNGHVLGGRDLLRKEQGTWLGMTKDGRIAVLTNFREEGSIPLEARSRGAMVNAFLTEPTGTHQGTQAFVETLTEDERLKGVGGFSLVCGRVGEPLAVISNRTPNVDGITWIAKDDRETVGLSNAAFANRTWPKVLKGEDLHRLAIHTNVMKKGSKDSFIEEMFGLLSNDTLPKRSAGMGWDAYVKELRKSIFIPAIGGEGAENLSAGDLAAATSDQHIYVDTEYQKIAPSDGQSGVYGTQKQTVMLVNRKGTVTFVERTLYDETGRATSAAERDRRFEFDIRNRLEET